MADTDDPSAGPESSDPAPVPAQETPTEVDEPSSGTEEAPEPAAPSRSGIAAGGAPRVSRPILLIGAVVIWTFGFVVGLFVGVRHGTAPPPEGHAAEDGAEASRPDHPVSGSGAAPQRTATPRAVAGSGLDLGSAEAVAALRGEWDPTRELPERAGAAAVTKADKASIVLSVPADGTQRSLTIVARAVGIAEDQAIEVTSSVGERQLATWSIKSAWALYLAKWPTEPPPTDAGTGNEVLLDLAITLPEGAVGSEEHPVGVAIDHLQVIPLGETASLDLRTMEGRSRLLAGFWGVEEAGDGNAFAWSRGKRSTMAVALAPSSGDYTLEVRAGAFEALVPLNVTAHINGKPVGGKEMGGEDSDYVYTVPAGYLVDGVNTIELTYPKTARPSEHVGGEDTRAVSISFSGLSLAPAGE